MASHPFPAIGTPHPIPSLLQGHRSPHLPAIGAAPCSSTPAIGVLLPSPPRYSGTTPLPPCYRGTALHPFPPSYRGCSPPSPCYRGTASHHLPPIVAPHPHHLPTTEARLPVRPPLTIGARLHREGTPPQGRPQPLPGVPCPHGAHQGSRTPRAGPPCCPQAPRKGPPGALAGPPTGPLAQPGSRRPRRATGGVPAEPVGLRPPLELGGHKRFQPGAVGKRQKGAGE